MCHCLSFREEGIALVIALIALALLSLAGMYIAFNAASEVGMSDNFESDLQARAAARAGLNHARELLRGLDYNGLLQGPDGACETGAYLVQARTFSFRNPVSWVLARTLDIENPASAIAGFPDDGVINTGRIAAAAGIVLIPQTGIAQTAANPYGAGIIITGRYFVKVADNNGEPSEMAADGADSPFLDGDGIIIVRSMGMARTLREILDSSIRRNSVAVFEARFKRRITFNLDSPLVVQGSAVLPSASSMFEGDLFSIQGGAGNAGIGTIDTSPADGISPAADISSQLAGDQLDNVEGMGLRPSVCDISGLVSSNPDKSLLLSPAHVWDFVNIAIPQFADAVYQGDQTWEGGNAPSLGSYDPSLPGGLPGQDPRVTLVNGDLSVSGAVTGGGLLVVTGKFSSSGSFSFNGLVLVAGAGDLDAGGFHPGISGGIYLARVEMTGGAPSFGTPKLTVRGNSRILLNPEAIRTAIGLIPPSQRSFREVTSTMDP